MILTMTLIYIHGVTFVSRMDRRIYPARTGVENTVYNPRSRTALPDITKITAATAVDARLCLISF